MFKCDCCGECCRHIYLSPIYAGLDRGDGVCKFFIDEKSLCSIYKNRPVECNVDAMYEKYFSEKMSRQEFYELNYKVCKKLKEISICRGKKRKIP